MSDDLDPNDPIVGFLRSTDPGDPPVTLGPGSSLRHRAAVRHARRQAVGAVLAVGLIGVAVVGSVVGTRHHAKVTTASHLPIASVSISTRADQSPIPSHSASAAPSTASPGIISAPTTPTSTTIESVKPNTQSASPMVPTITSMTFRNPGPIRVGQSVFFTVRYVVQGSVAPGWTHVDYGDRSFTEGSSCPTTADAPTTTGSSALSGEISTPSHTFMTPGTYTVTVTVGFGCVAGAQTKVVTKTIVVTGPTPSTSSSPSAPASESPSPSVSPSAPALGSLTPAP